MVMVGDDDNDEVNNEIGTIKTVTMTGIPVSLHGNKRVHCETVFL